MPKMKTKKCATKRMKLSRLMNPSELYETIRNLAGVDTRSSKKAVSASRRWL